MYYTSQEVADKANVTRMTVSNWRKIGVIKPFFIPKSKFGCLYLKDEIDNFLAIHERKRNFLIDYAKANV